MNAILNREIVKKANHFVVIEDGVETLHECQGVYDLAKELSSFLIASGVNSELPLSSQIGDVIQFYQLERIISEIRKLDMTWFPGYVDRDTKVTFLKAKQSGKEVNLTIGDPSSGYIWEYYKGILKRADKGLPKLTIETYLGDFEIPFGFVLQLETTEDSQVLFKLETDLEKKFKKLKQA